MQEFEYDIRTKEENGKEWVFDPIRKRYFVLTPEEWVRQHVLYYLVHFLGYPPALLAVERSWNKSKKRFDILVHASTTGAPVMIVECKRQSERLSQVTLNQIGRYNMTLEVPYLVVTNWEKWMVVRVDRGAGKFEFLDELPRYEDL
ncbi:MAG: type I restriction enzyme HsdR N-terminal domain-containing protein [Saprospiraceae bacterium]|nr:type I restriction enzyme HsdR N-terminal domain-containing protein [Saprospiraceae bacterium]